MIRFKLVILLLVSSAFAFGQDNSVFSRFGIGDIEDAGYTSQALLGGAAAAYVTPYTINSVNPASYSHLSLAVFDIGAQARYFQADLNGRKSDALWSGALGNVAFAAPLRNAINKNLNPIKKPTDYGIAVGVNPISKVGYDIFSYKTLPDIGQIEQNYEGTGGLYRFFIGGSVKYKDFSFGLNGTYNFGRINYASRINFVELQYPFDSEFTTSYNAKGLGLDYGILYKYTFDKDNDDIINKSSLTFGLHGSIASKLNTVGTIENIAIQYIDRNTASIDTIRYDQDIEGELKLPSSIGLGVAYNRGNKWGLTASTSFTTWSNYENTLNPENLQNVSSINFGTWYTPNAKSYASYFNRIVYKLGGFYKSEPNQLASDDPALDDIQHYGITAGFQLPFRNKRTVSRADIGVILGYKGNNILSERYVKVRFGFTFNDEQWFLKRKYN